MPENDQIQPGFQPEIQTNPQVQQNNLVQNQQINQEIVQQNNVGAAEQDLSQSSKPRSSRLTKIVGCMFGLLGIALIGLGIYGVFETQSDRHYSDYTIRDIIMDSGIFILGPLGIWLIILGILSYRTPNVDIYYHPTRLTKILSGIYRFLGIALIRAGLRNFSLIGTEDLSFLKILYVGGVITLCGILYILLGRLLYNTKNKMHLGFSMLCALIINIMFARILRAFTDNNRFLVDNDTLESFGTILVLFTLIYFSILTIRWIIKCRKFNKKGLINSKYLGSTPSKKKVGIIITIVLYSLVIIDLIYGKIQWSKIPEIDESMFNRIGHQTKLPDEEDALIQLKLFQEKIYGLDNDKIMENLERISLLLGSYDENEKIEWKYYPEECIKIYSGGNEYCGTWAWNKNTLNRWLNHQLVISQNEDYRTKERTNEYLSIDGKKVTILEYMDTYEPEIRKNFQELNRILSMEYYLPDDEVLDLIPQFLQGWSRSSISAIRYYIYKGDWDMVMFIIKMNYKIADILNNIGSVIGQLISLVIQGITDSSINTQIQLFPADFREELSHRYSTQINDKNEIIEKIIKGEYVIWNWAKNGNIMGEIGKDTPSLFQFLFHFPFYSEKEINNLMNYSYYEDWNYLKDNNEEPFLDENFNKPSSLYNIFGMYPFYSLKPRMQSINDRMDRALYHKDALIKNLESGKYDVRFNKPDWESNPYEYESYRLPTDEELFENKIKEYSDITNPCFGKDIMDEPFFDFGDFGNICSQTLSELKEQEKDNFGLREILIEISQLWIDYDKIGAEVNNCFSEKGDICESIFYEQYEILEKMEKAYIKFSDILETIKNKSLEINFDDYFYIPEMMMYDKLGDLELDDTKLNDSGSEDIDLPESLSIIKEYSDIIEPCFGKDVIDPIPDIGVYHDEFEEICLKTQKELERQGKDIFGLKEILIEITKSLVDYSEFEINVDACWLKEGTLPDACKKIFDKEEELVDNIKHNYIRLSEILKNIENKNPGININKYFYIPYEKVYDDNNLLMVGFFIDEGKAKEILNDMILQESIDKINKNEKKIISGNKSNEQLNYEKLANLTNMCIGEDILNGKMELSYDNHISQCNYGISELKKASLTGDFIKLNKILLFISKEWIEHANIEKEEDLLFKTDGIVQESKYGKIYQNGDSPEWDVLFGREDKNLENFKKYYLELENLTNKIKEKYEINPEIDFYIPYSIIKENTFKFFYKDSNY